MEDIDFSINKEDGIKANERDLVSVKKEYIKKILELLNSNLAACGDTSYDRNMDLNAILEALPACTISVIYSLQLAKPLLIDVLKAQAQVFLAMLEPLIHEESQDLYKAMESKPGDDVTCS